MAWQACLSFTSAAPPFPAMSYVKHRLVCPPRGSHRPESYPSPRQECHPLRRRTHVHCQSKPTPVSSGNLPTFRMRLCPRLLFRVARELAHRTQGKTRYLRFRFCHWRITGFRSQGTSFFNGFCLRAREPKNRVHLKAGLAKFGVAFCGTPRFMHEDITSNRRHRRWNPQVFPRFVFACGSSESVRIAVFAGFAEIQHHLQEVAENNCRSVQ